MQSYITVKTPAIQTYTIQKSRFISMIRPIQSLIEANEWLRTVKKEYYRATHHCYGFVIDSKILKSSDDGEPSGTAGQPILEQIQAMNCFFTGIIVIRYYGGVKLGTGGLVRAYTEGAKLALDAATMVTMDHSQQLTLYFDYVYFGRLEYELRQHAVINEEPIYLDKVIWNIWVSVPTVSNLVAQLQNWTNGQIEIKYGERTYQPL
ncbi:uncharacterized protein, YigZ family [Seinonella peptonophila]|uniref:Uncharacterized protein, YigZ family n=1 Tax=Seinonella peptonophila TaxID=112248 RepID=A0A1M4XRS4_9BACL|nr:YigZ family protein [Seinonella peptonophila]SHE96189.1 uncharacterized protein, YigZ family [Seinonella peptonophila]